MLAEAQHVQRGGAGDEAGDEQGDGKTQQAELRTRMQPPGGFRRRMLDFGRAVLLVHSLPSIRSGGGPDAANPDRQRYAGEGAALPAWFAIRLADGLCFVACFHGAGAGRFVSFQ